MLDNRDATNLFNDLIQERQDRCKTHHSQVPDNRGHQRISTPVDERNRQGLGRMSRNILSGEAESGFATSVPSGASAVWRANKAEEG